MQRTSATSFAVSVSDDLANAFGDFSRMTFPNVEPVIFGLRAGEVGEVIGRPGTCKSTLAMNLVLSVASGRQYGPLFDGGNPRRVLYLDFENTAAMLKADLIRMADGLTEGEQKLVDENLFVGVDMTIHGNAALDLSIDAHFNAILRRAVERGVELVVVDTLAEGFSMRNENDNSEMKRIVVTPLKRLARMSNAATLIIHHSGKMGLDQAGFQSPIYQGRGASSLACAARLIVNMDHVRDSDGMVIKDQVRLSCAKVKGQAFPSTRMRVNPVSRWLGSTTVELEEQARANALRVSAELNRKLSVITSDESGTPRKQILAALPQHTRREVDGVLDRAIKSGDVVKVGYGRYRRLPKSLSL